MSRYIIISVLLLVSAITSSFYSAGIADDNPFHQLRIYTVPKENQKVFQERFKDGRKPG